MPRSEPRPRRALEAARLILGYLSETDAKFPPVDRKYPCDAIMGFGVFDLRLPRFCGELYLKGVAPYIIFAGGIGAGTGNLGGPEADVWGAELRRAYPSIGDDIIILENRSTNTAENISFTAELLMARYPELRFNVGIRRVAVVASPSRLRRVWLTLRQLQPTLEVFRLVPSVDFDAERELYGRNATDYLAHLSGELDRIVDYPRRGWTVAEPLPADIAAAHAVLRETLRSDEGRRPLS